MDRPLRPCAFPGCPHLTRSKGGCPEHRHTPTGRYDRAWAELALAWLKANPTCATCRRPAREVDHIVEVRVDPTRRLDPTNLRSLCSPCHVKHTAATRAWTEHRPRGKR
jgi:5-methylcytosine-specific restriction protein A